MRRMHYVLATVLVLMLFAAIPAFSDVSWGVTFGGPGGGVVIGSPYYYPYGGYYGYPYGGYYPYQGYYNRYPGYGGYYRYYPYGGGYGRHDRDRDYDRDRYRGYRRR